MKNLILFLCVLLAVSCNPGFDVKVEPGKIADVEVPATPDVRCSAPAIGPDFHAGSGTALDPFLICTTTQWNGINAYCGANADCAGTNFLVGHALTFSNLDTSGDLTAITALDNNVTPIVTFAGNIDGGNHIIKGIILYGATKAALISNYTGVTGSLENIKVRSSYFNTAAADYAGTLIAFVDVATVSDLTVENVEVLKNVLKGNDYVGGVIGYAETITSVTMSNVKYDLYLSGNGSVGGMVGSLITPTSTLSEVLAVVEIEATDAKVGGVIGASTSVVALSDVTVSGTVDSVGAQVGGILGLNENAGEFSITDGSVSVVASGDFFVGGVMGANFFEMGATRLKVKSTVNSDTTWCGGFLGMNAGPADYDDVSVTSTVNSLGGKAGGFFGENNGPVTASNIDVITTVNILGASFYGGLAGSSNTIMNFTDLNVTANIIEDPSAPATIEDVGGILGISNGFNTSFTTAKFKVVMKFLSGSTYNRAATFIGTNNAQYHLTGTTLSAVARSSGTALTCTDVNSFIGNDNGAGSTHQSTTLSIDFSQVQCL